jgi:hypothetical protein
MLGAAVSGNLEMLKQLQNAEVGSDIETALGVARGNQRLILQYLHHCAVAGLTEGPPIGGGEI